MCGPRVPPCRARGVCQPSNLMALFLPQIREEIDKFGIHVYQFPECDSDEDEDFKQQDRELKVYMQPSGQGRELGASSYGPRGPSAQVQLGGGQGSCVWAVEPPQGARAALFPAGSCSWASHGSHGSWSPWQDPKAQLLARAPPSSAPHCSPHGSPAEGPGLLATGISWIPEFCWWLGCPGG